MFASAILDSMNANTGALANLKAGLIKGSIAVTPG